MCVKRKMRARGMVQRLFFKLLLLLFYSRWIFVHVYTSLYIIAKWLRSWDCVGYFFLSRPSFGSILFYREINWIERLLLKIGPRIAGIYITEFQNYIVVQLLYINTYIYIFRHFSRAHTSSSLNNSLTYIHICVKLAMARAIYISRCIPRRQLPLCAKHKLKRM